VTAQTPETAAAALLDPLPRRLGELHGQKEKQYRKSLGFRRAIGDLCRWSEVQKTRPKAFLMAARRRTIKKATPPAVPSSDAYAYFQRSLNALEQAIRDPALIARYKRRPRPLGGPCAAARNY